MPTMSTPLATLLQSEMDARGWSQRAMAEAAGLSNHAVVGNILRGTTAMPQLDTLAALARGLANDTVSAAEYFRRLVRAAGYGIEEGRPAEALDRLDSMMSEEQRRRLARMTPERALHALTLILEFAEDPPPPHPE